jgi:hypothetical protein
LTKDGKGIVITRFSGKVKKVVIPAKIEDVPVVEIGDNVFKARDVSSKTLKYYISDEDEAGITSITIPNTVKKIGREAFRGIAITKFDMPDSVTEIGGWLFDFCLKLTEIHLLNGSIVFVGLNVGNTKHLTGDWKNFHAPARGGATRLQTLLGNTKYKGAYMTDIITNEPMPTAAELMEKIKQKKIDVNTHIKNFIEEIDLLKTNTIEMFLFGKDVETLFRDHVMNHADFPALKKKIKTCQQIDHYSTGNTGFMVKASAQLGLDVPKNLLWG